MQLTCECELCLAHGNGACTTNTVDPMQVTKFDRTERELQLFWIFAMLVAGKNADVQSRALARLFRTLGEKEMPFDFLRSRLNDLHNTLVVARVGQYARLERAIKESLDLDLKTATVEELEAVYGVGPKTARFFILHSRPNAEHAALDVHILAWLADHYEGIPKVTPPKGEKYRALERLFIGLAMAKYPYLTLAQVDLKVWAEYSGRTNNE